MMRLLKKNRKEVLSWKDIKLSQLQEIHTLPEYEDKIDLMVNVLSILLDKDPYDIENMLVTDIFKEYERWTFLQEPPKEELIPIIKHNGKRYGIIELDKMSLGQYGDVEEYLSEGNVFDNIHRVLSVLYLPVKKYNPFNGKYELEDYTPSVEREEMFKEMTMDVIYPTILFFYHIVNNFLIDFQHSLIEKKEKELKKMISLEEEQLEKLKKDNEKKLEENGI